MIPNFTFYICSRGSVSKFHDKDITDIISIRNNLSDKIYIKHYPGFPLKPKVWIYIFEDDIQEGTINGPTEIDIQSIIDFAKNIQSRLKNGEKVQVCVHCEAGISRSTAAAYIILNVLAGPFREIACLHEVLRIRDCAVPNDLMVKFADKILQRDGKMYDVVRAYNKQLKLRPWMYE